MGLGLVVPSPPGPLGPNCGESIGSGALQTAGSLKYDRSGALGEGVGEEGGEARRRRRESGKGEEVGGGGGGGGVAPPPQGSPPSHPLPSGGSTSRSYRFSRGNTDLRPRSD